MMVVFKFSKDINKNKHISEDGLECHFLTAFIFIQVSVNMITWIILPRADQLVSGRDMRKSYIFTLLVRREISAS